MKLLLAGDLHIGRASTAVPEALPYAQRRTVEAWDALVELALHERVDVVCLSGDIADHDNGYWETMGALQRGVTRLVEADIDVYAVSGNHDHKLLPEVVDQLAEQLNTDRLQLLGRDGQWQRATVHRDGQPMLHIDGWSFPDTYVRRSPLNDYNLPAAHDAPVLGLLHGDVDDPASDYAPLTMPELREPAVNGWLLGHIHKPGFRDDGTGPFVLYPGSPQAMDPGEPGAHGVWLAQVTAGQFTRPTHRPISTVRYDTVSVALDDVQTEADFRQTVRETLLSQAEQFARESGDPLACLSLRLELRGRTPLLQEVPRLSAELRDQFDERVADNVPVTIDRIASQAEPAIDLHACAAQPGTLTGHLARLLLELDKDEPDDPAPQLIREARQQIRTTRQDSYYTGLPDTPDADDRLARQYLAEQARALLAELHAQQEAT